MVIDLINIFISDNKYLEVIQVIKEFGECLISLLDYLGDSNQKLREKTEKIIYDYTKKTKSFGFFSLFFESENKFFILVLPEFFLTKSEKENNSWNCFPPIFI